ncbi:hypothetical protein KJ937_02745, partial [Patescibacteria group bacterium]|nr:hypothetical protein [Patescibacteria group bacterium]
MKKQIWQEINRTVVFIAVAAVAGALAGATAALIVTPLDVTRLTLLNQTSSTIQVYGSTTTEPTFVRVEPRLVAPLLPPGFITRRASPVATVYSKAKGFSLEGRSLTPDKILGQA